MSLLHSLNIKKILGTGLQAGDLCISNCNLA
jgi:hypothetical protein